MGLAVGIVAPKGSLRHEGKPLAWWVSELAQNESSTNAAAVRAIGEPAVPFLMARLRTNAFVIPPWARFLPGHLNVEERFYQVYSQERAEAIVALQTLGPQAQSALPELLSNRNGQYVTEEYFDVILAIDGDPRKTLDRAVRKGERGLTCSVLAHIAPAQWQQAGVVRWSPELMESVRNLTTNSDPWVRRAAFKAMLSRNLKPEPRQRYLTEGLKDSSPLVQNEILQHFQTRPTELWLVLPEVQALTNNKACRMGALQALAAGKLVSWKVVQAEAQKEWQERQRAQKERQKRVKMVSVK